MRVVDADEVHLTFAGLAVGAQQILRTQFVARGLRTVGRVIERQRMHDGFVIPIDRTYHRAAALVRICSLRVIHHLAPGLTFNRNHCQLVVPEILAQVLVGAIAQDGDDHGLTSFGVQFRGQLQRAA